MIKKFTLSVFKNETQISQLVANSYCACGTGLKYKKRKSTYVGRVQYHIEQEKLKEIQQELVKENREFFVAHYETHNMSDEQREWAYARNPRQIKLVVKPQYEQKYLCKLETKKVLNGTKLEDKLEARVVALL